MPNEECSFDGDPFDKYSNNNNNFPTDQYIEDSKESIDSQEYIEDTSKSLIKSPKETYPPIFMNNSKE